MELMPRKRFLDTMKFSRLYSQKLPDKNTSNPALYELYLTSNLWVAFLNNAASEQSARMSAMENASKNAKEIVNKLNLQYNKARQARITMELVEIISGASALWGSLLKIVCNLLFSCVPNLKLSKWSIYWSDMNGFNMSTNHCYPTHNSTRSQIKISSSLLTYDFITNISI